jgi:hypothetical protein
MACMRQRKHLNPAYDLILKFGGPDGTLNQGIDAVATITGVNKTRVYRWMYPREKGGTDGLIPNKHAIKLIAHAREQRLAIDLEDFFSGARVT